MVEPSAFADTVTPSSFWPAAELIAPENTTSAAYACVNVAAATVVRRTPPSVASVVLRVMVMVMLMTPLLIRVRRAARAGRAVVIAFDTPTIRDSLPQV